jgi:peroxiredoxin
MQHSTTAVLLIALWASVWTPSAVARPDVAGLLDPIPEQPEAPGFDLEGPDGETYRLADMRGKPVIVNFWATWCPPCRAEMPALQRAWEQLEEQGVMLVAVNVGETKEEIDAFAAQVEVDFPLPMDTEMTVSQSWPMRGLPTTFVVDPEGRLVYRAQGEREWDDPALLELVLELRR